MAAYLENLRGENPIVANLRDIPSFFRRPLPIFQTYQRTSWRPDIIAGLTVAVVLLPQAIAYALIAELPPEMGLYTAIIGAIIGVLWGSSNHLQTGPTNAISLLVLSTLVTVSMPGTAQYVILAGLLAVMVGVLQLVMGLARLGVLVNFVSHSVIVGFSAGAGVLIAIRQLQPLLGLDFTSHSFIETIGGAGGELIAGNIHWPTAALGLGTILILVLLKRFSPKLPGPLIGMIAAAGAVALLGLDQNGVDVIGELPRGLPPLAQLPLFDLELIGQLSTGALAIAAIGLIEAMSIARSISNQSNQRLDSNQEFVGQGLANIDISGDLYFGAVSHIEKAISRHRRRHPEQRFLLLRIHSVNQCDFSGIHAPETVIRIYRDQGVMYLWCESVTISGTL